MVADFVCLLFSFVEILRLFIALTNACFATFIVDLRRPQNPFTCDNMRLCFACEVTPLVTLAIC